MKLICCPLICNGFPALMMICASSLAEVVIQYFQTLLQCNNYEIIWGWQVWSWKNYQFEIGHHFTSNSRLEEFYGNSEFQRTMTRKNVSLGSMNARYLLQPIAGIYFAESFPIGNIINLTSTSNVLVIVKGIQGNGCIHRT